MAGDQTLGSFLIGEERHRLVDIGHLDREPDRLAMPASARQLVGVEREGPPVRGEQQKLIGCLTAHDVLGVVAFLELQVGKIAMAAQGSDPALFRQDHRHRLARDEGFDIDLCGHRLGFAEFSAPLAPMGARTEQLARFLEFAGDAPPLLAGVFEQAFKLLLLLAQARVFAADFHLLQLPQLPQAGVEDGFGLHVVQLEAGDQLWLRLSSLRMIGSLHPD